MGYAICIYLLLCGKVRNNVENLHWLQKYVPEFWNYSEAMESFLFTACSCISLQPTVVCISLVASEAYYMIIAINVPVNTAAR